MKPIIDVKQVNFSYKQMEDEQTRYEPALRGISMSITQGSFVAIVGHNGSGKSTIAKQLNALLLPDDGIIYVDGICTADADALWTIRKNVGMIFQNPDNQMVATIVEEDVAFGPENLGMPREEIRCSVDEALERVGMQEFANHASHMLSGGQKQRIAIAGIIAMRPKVIVFDESTAMLDPKGRQDILRVALDLNRNEGITVVWITHFMDEAVQADKIIVMDAGSVVMNGTPKEIFRETKTLYELGLEPPFAIQLADKLREQNFEIPNDILTLDQLTEVLCPLL